MRRSVSTRAIRAAAAPPTAAASAVLAFALALLLAPGSARATAAGGATGAAATGAAPALTPAAAEETSPPATTGGRLPGLVARPAAAPDLPRPPADPAERRAWLKGALDEVFATPALARAKVGVIVVESDTGRTLYARSEKAPLNAASNVKIVTSAAALAELGPDYRWRTGVYAGGSGKGGLLGPAGELAGDLYVRGGGDPTLTTEDLAAIAGDLAARGLRRVKGAIVVDEGFFDGGHLAPAYDQKQESTASRAASSAASLDGNVVTITVVPAAKPGAAARVIVAPSSAYFTVTGRVVTSGSGPAVTSVETREDHAGGDRTEVQVAGRVRAGSDPRTFRRRVVSPPLFLGYTLKALLERRGIPVGQTPRVGNVPGQAALVLAHESAPLGVVVHDLNKRSNNFTAEQVLRTLGAELLGRPGTWEKGIEAVARYLGGLGVRKGAYQMTNGSGLYDSNRFSPEQIATVLRGAMRDFRIGAELMASLAVAGTDGTIAHRMGNTPAERYVRAKTGTLAGTSCLSGFAGSPGHMPLVFSILMNDLAAPSDGRHAQDRAAELLVSYIEAGSGATAAGGKESAGGNATPGKRE